MTKRIFITGAAGFIGYHLTKALCKRGDALLGVDNFNSYYDPALKRCRQKKLKERGISIKEIDLLDLKKLQQEISTFEPTHIVNLAAQAGVRYSLEAPQAYMDSNILGFLNVLESCRQIPNVKLIYASSSSVYGTNTKTPFSEDDRTDSQASLYGVTKKTNELMASSYHHLFGISSTALRFFTVYGPYGRPDMAYFSFTKKIVDREPIQVFNEGKLQRDFTYIDDVVQGTVAAIDLGAPLEIFNLGNHRPTSLLSFIEILEDAIGIKAIKEFCPMQQGDVFATCADISHSKEMLGYHPVTTLEEGIPKFIDWYRKTYPC